MNWSETGRGGLPNVPLCRAPSAAKRRTDVRLRARDLAHGRARDLAHGRARDVLLTAAGLGANPLCGRSDQRAGTPSVVQALNRLEGLSWGLVTTPAAG